MKRSTIARADYGLDAPNVVRNLFLGGVSGLVLWGTARFGLWSGDVRIPVGNSAINIGLAPAGLWCGIGFLVTGCWMVWSSKSGKVVERERLLGRIPWRGDEQVLDLGCGRGLLLVGAAKRLTTGKATGIDIWQAEDLSGNRPEATLENARLEGVADRVEVKSADMRQLPFADASIYVVVSRAAIHNLYSADDRAKAIREVARVLKPGGRALIEDIRHQGEYAATFAQNGCADIQRIGSPIVSALCVVVTMGSLRPGTLLVRKTG
jgi:SAM-dependent methyltransferase